MPMNCVGIAELVLEFGKTEIVGLEIAAVPQLEVIPPEAKDLFDFRLWSGPIRQGLELACQSLDHEPRLAATVHRFLLHQSDTNATKVMEAAARGLRVWLERHPYGSA